MKLFIVSYWFSELSETFLEFRPKIRPLLSMLHCKIPEELYDDKFSQEVPIFFAFPVFDWNFVWLSTVIFRQGCQNYTLHFWMKTLRSEIFSSKNIILLIFYYLDQINSQTLVIIFGPSYQNCFQGVEKAALNFFSNFFSNICLILIELSYDTCLKRKWSSKLLYYCLDKFFGVNICFWYKTNSPIFCRTLTELLSVFLP